MQNREVRAKGGGRMSEGTTKEKNSGRREKGSRGRGRGRGAGADCRKSLVPFQGTSIELASGRVG